MRNFLNWITRRGPSNNAESDGKASSYPPPDVGQASPAPTSDQDAASDSHNPIGQALRHSMREARFNNEMVEHRYAARTQPEKSPAAVATALKSLDATVFDDEISSASTKNRGILAFYRKELSEEHDPLSKSALMLRTKAMSLGFIQGKKNREAMMKVLAYAEVSSGKEQETINTRFFELTSPSNYVPHVESEKTLVRTLQDTLAPHVATIQAEGEQSGFDKADRAVLGLLVDKEGAQGKKADMNSIRKVNAMLASKGGMLREDMRTDLMAVHRVANEATRVRRPRVSDAELV